MVTPRLRPMGERALLAEVDDLPDVLALHAALAAAPPDGIDDLVPAARTVLIAFDPSRITSASVRAWVRSAGDAPPEAASPGPLVEIAVRYDGADLDETAAMLGIRTAELVARHAAAEWNVAFTGFAPGFAYLVSEDWPWDVPRLSRPRTRVPAGSVGLAGGFTGAYPRETPGGWRLIGTTDAPLFTPDAADPVLLAPGARVRFVPHRTEVRTAASEPAGPVAPAPAGSSAPSPPGDEPASPALRVLDAGPLATVQDLGRPGRAGLGVARSGVLDRAALRAANRLVGNAETAAGIEIVLGGFRARAERDTWVAVAGALADIRVDGHAVDAYAPLLVPAGSELSIGVAIAGARLVLAVRGGVAGAAALGSRATDVLASLGPAALVAGDAVVVGEAPAPIPVVDAFPWSVPGPVVEVGLAPGPRADWFAPAALRTLRDATWTVSGDADRVGIRLDGPALDRVRHDELPSEGMRPGALQVPPHGRPVVLLADGPVTGGYPVIAVVTDATLDRLAQVRPGDRVRFRGP
ncbi:5-oxoprolinase/urea amidolyase family protein [Microbacterium testaceum]|uniref:5-oxoprolinase subunit B/C family protein n=2 Tax=Microbacterium testaceum TaxID=2033 RepID=UPI001D17AA6D|nr:urea amidolyase family protein [Microbacterium testaceum]MCC4248649.1 5-oxoprolinase/urea amidolyase family protein [Microbacterium testaceum]